MSQLKSFLDRGKAVHLGEADDDVLLVQAGEQLPPTKAHGYPNILSRSMQESSGKAA